MDYAIYHSRDLDGKTSGALASMLLNVNPNNLIGYDYGEKLDLRKFKNKEVLIADVSLEPERMISLANNSSKLVWVDHHISQLKSFLEYLDEHSIKYETSVITDLIKCYYIPELDFTHYYSDRLSACEIMVRLFKYEGFSKDAERIVRGLGQYDTWRNTDDKQFLNDENWFKVILPLQWGMREFNTPEKVKQTLLGNLDSGSFNNVFPYLVSKGHSILKYQESIDSQNIARLSFDFDLKIGKKTLRVIALNGGPFNSNTFESVWNPDYHDIMMPFVFNGKAGFWTFSMYTTKTDVDILAIAKKLGGGGHKQACGFQVAVDKVSFKGNKIVFADLEKK